MEAGGGWPTLSFASILKLGLPHPCDFCNGGNNYVQLIRIYLPRGQTSCLLRG